MKINSKILILLLLEASLTWGQGFAESRQDYKKIRIKVFNDSVAKASLPTSIDLSKYTPKVIYQQNYGTCVAFATTYYMRTILDAIKLGITDKDSITAMAYSPSYIFNLAKDSSNINCKDGTIFERALDSLKAKGVAKFSEQTYPHCGKNNPIVLNNDSKIMDYNRLFSVLNNENKVISTKKALSEQSPVVVGIHTTASIFRLKISGFRKFWHKVLNFFGVDDDEFALWNPDGKEELDSGHAVCIVGYDDKKFKINGKTVGAFKAVNSWSEDWGDEGFFWISYNAYETYAKQAYQAYLYPKNKGEIDFGAEVTFLESGRSTENETPCEYFTNQKGDDILTAYTITKPLETGSRFKFGIYVSKQAYVYVIGENATQNISTVTFPTGFIMSELIGSDSKVILPFHPKEDSTDNSIAQEFDYELQAPTGTEYSLFLFSKEKLNTRLLAWKLNKIKKPFAEKIMEVLGKDLVPFGEVQYDKKSKQVMRFQISGKHNGTIVPLMIKYEHIPRKRF